MLFRGKGKRIKQCLDYIHLLLEDRAKQATFSWSKCPKPEVTEYYQLVIEDLGGGVKREIFCF